MNCVMKLGIGQSPKHHGKKESVRVALFNFYVNGNDSLVNVRQIVLSPLLVAKVHICGCQNQL